MVRKIRRLNRGLLACLGAAVLAIAISGVVITQAQTQTQTFTCSGGFTEEVAPPVVMTSLLAVPNPVIPKDPVTGARLIREDLVDYVANLDAAIRLGKTFFWDMQAGSDNQTACATCHFAAGADSRTRNQLHPGANGVFDVAAGANGELNAAAFPFTQLGVSDADDIAGSQGVRMSTFGSISKSGGEVTSPAADPVFNVGGTNVRQVTGRAAPANYNAVFNHRNFWDGRAQAEFNGVNPFGNRDPSARVWFVSPLGPTQIDIHIKNAGLASQALGPILSDVEMSAKNRSLPDVGKKLFALKPLGLQQVDPTDSVLGPFADPTSTGLRTTYKAMVQAAFKSKWWNTTKTISIGRKSYTMMEANFGLFWGLSIMLYQATLVSDQTPMDRYLASRMAGAADPSLLDDVVARMQGLYPGITRENVINGLRLFELPPPFEPAPNGAGCMLCHVGAETTSASNRNLNHGVEADDIAFANGGFDQRMERMFWQIPALTPGTDKITFDPMAWAVKEYNTVAGTGPTDVPLAVYDTGYYNVGVRPTAEDRGEENVDPWGKSFSVVRWLQQTLADTSNYKVPGAGVNCGATLVTNSTGYPLLSGTLRKTERARVDGAFKVPGLRNVELTAPYMHNGGKATLFQVVEFYDDGGDFKNPDLAPLMKPLNLGPDDIRDLVAFLIALTDERVRWQRAPFDHPQLFVPHGDSTPGVDNIIEIPAVGAAGGSAVQPFLGLNPFN